MSQLVGVSKAIVVAPGAIGRCGPGTLTIPPPAYIQSATSVYGNSQPTTPAATFSSPATAGNLLVAVVVGAGTEGAGLGQITVSAPGWSVASDQPTPCSNGQGGALFSRVIYRIAVGGETTFTVDLVTAPTGGVVPDGAIMVNEYAGTGPPTVTAAIPITTGCVGGSSTAPLPTVTPPSGRPGIVYAATVIEPNYTVTFPGAFTKRIQNNGGQRDDVESADEIVASTSGTYGGGTCTGPGGETGWTTHVIAFTRP